MASGAGGSGSTSGNGGAAATTGAGAGPLCNLVPTGECTMPDDTDPCICCAAENCLVESNNCCNEPGCIAIVECAQRTGCMGFGCYDPATCQTEIDAAGGPLGNAVSVATALGDCVEVPCTGCDMP